MTKSIPNKHRVSVSQWRKWSARERALFNDTLDDILHIGPSLFLHPVTVQRKLSEDEFYTIAWNAAWIATDMLKGRLTEQVVTYHDDEVIAVDNVRSRAA